MNRFIKKSNSNSYKAPSLTSTAMLNKNLLRESNDYTFILLKLERKKAYC